MFRVCSTARTGIRSPSRYIRPTPSRHFPKTASVNPHTLPAWRLQRAPFASKNEDRTDPPPPKQPIDYEAERKRGERKLEARPKEVSVNSSIPNELKTPVENKADNPILQNELQHDAEIIKETFSLNDVPRESKVLGLAGTIPYFATSLSTIYLGWDLKQSIPTGNTFYDAIVIDHGTAQYLLSVIEPVQLGYGAVIISFLGAIHWGLEYAEKRPHAERTRFRYGMGLIAPIIAWPTLIMPVPYALTTQFMAFVGLYFADARATTRGWAPTWYGSYRFMLTAMVGLALFVSLVGRQKIGQGNALSAEGLQSRIERTGRADREADWAKLEAEEKERRRKERVEAEKKSKKKAEETKQDQSNKEDDKTNNNKDDNKNDKDDNKKDDSKKDDSKKDDSKKDDSKKDDSKKDDSKKDDKTGK